MSAAPCPPYQSLPNSFRHAVRSGDTLIGCWASLASPIVTELLGVIGFDWMLLDAEHAPNDVLTLIPQLMSLKDSRSAPVVRPPANDSVVIKRLLDSGFSNFLVPFVDNADDAARAVAATRYPPQGVRGVSVAHRGNRYATVPGYFDMANQNVCVIVQIESRAAVDSIDAILAVDGVDAVFVGPSDLAASYGHLGNAAHPQVQQAIAHVFERAQAAGKPSGILAPVQADAERYLAMGCRVIAVCADLGLLRNAAQDVHRHFIKKPADAG
ncbi:2-dehydro-3-deoxyglucarate aldolase [bacterium M00.F.Ca.ET.228.01.1.1]|uniref:2-dehydro-3-deoxyglucarate aldolase n=1 Tax=Paraburkholderia phenoliruptrix TaxID=252970 RepID=UPI001092E1F0|nr:2-dehydro-3-deoxyglucarate aldolase [Paraburkholderia phenoliruptrix]MBW9132798.1 2-dehydro-3-deoxyglucarate aldolase [Paraburkholderia ginsengiterrae]TGP40716.1 2-dehydro-3-deoxyglucarate aldolase [bacterium M00.F.Ca.ET.228.01.1.1]TGR96967.1 2-dehydro-3-deoxyglucarate aldolase [bacterium M00.F.Ca.ET.191.01.1.1]TGT98277.1 2-dehydro-3-deoxyglucarate aldolase [bacterium M00.F.Ca.ET.155.01.1.1]MBW0448214.1 2-dehydro-3-deoxyglucarate aldolase [Paraburkholderia phenoliruptrix]